MSSAQGRVVVIGAGVIGAACAHYLQRAGWKVTLIDRGEFGKACSHANCGYVCPSHVLPLASPGAWRTGLHALLARNAALKIHPRLDWRLWAWLLQFARRCNRRDMLQAAVGIQALLNSSRILYEELIASERLDCEWQTQGLLFVFQTPRGLRHYAQIDRLLATRFARPARRIDSAELAQLEPALKPGLAGAFLYDSDAHLRPDRLLRSWHQRLVERQVEIREHCEFLDIHHRSSGSTKRSSLAHAIRTSQGDLEAEHFVFATGAWTATLARPLGIRLPIQPGKGYSITTDRPQLCPNYPLILEEHHVAITPMQTGYRIGSTMEFAGFDATLNRRRLELLRQGAREYLREPEGTPVREEWFGWRPMTPDGLPYIDRLPRWKNVWLAAGHNMLGLSMAPATGKLIAELLSGERPHLDPTPYRCHR